MKTKAPLQIEAENTLAREISEICEERGLEFTDAQKAEIFRRLDRIHETIFGIDLDVIDDAILKFSWELTRERPSRST